jgi:hypothetical protein
MKYTIVKPRKISVSDLEQSRRARRAAPFPREHLSRSLHQLWRDWHRLGSLQPLGKAVAALAERGRHRVPHLPRVYTVEPTRSAIASTVAPRIWTQPEAAAKDALHRMSRLICCGFARDGGGGLAVVRIAPLKKVNQYHSNAIGTPMS